LNFCMAPRWKSSQTRRVSKAGCAVSM
jgi:hypothetical protein